MRNEPSHIAHSYSMSPAGEIVMPESLPLPALRAPAALDDNDDDLARPVASSAAAAALLRSIERIEEIVEEETAALQRRVPIDLDDFSRRKSRGLLELTRAAAAFRTTSIDGHAAARLMSLKAKLEKNYSVLKLQLDAVKEIADILVEAARERDSDGTYSVEPRQSGPR